MEDTIFSLSRTNPNNSALVIPQEEGGSEDDHYFGSIGDATQKHVQALSQADRQLWEGLYSPNSGKIFRFDTQSTWHDPDPFNLSGEDLEDYFEQLKKTAKNGGLTENDIAPLREAIEMEQERREKSEDLYDHAEPIPYHMMQYYPNMMRHAEIPAPPKDKMVYIGNTTQMFYDQFMEEHPNAGAINTLLNMLNRDWGSIDEGFAEWFKKHLGPPLREEVSANFAWLVDQLVEGKQDPEDLTKQVLIGIENVWRKDYLAKASEKQKADALLMLIKLNQKKWREEAKVGQIVYGAVKQFGQLLWKEYRGKMKSHHWALYRAIKKEHAPRVLVRGIDINRCSINQLYYIFGDGAKGEKAEDKRKNKDYVRKIWLNRPFDNANVIQQTGYMTREVFIDNDESEPLIEKLEKARDAGMEALNVIRRDLIEAQRKKVYGNINWSPIWGYYHLLKNELQAKEQADGRKD